MFESLRTSWFHIEWTDRPRRPVGSPMFPAALREVRRALLEADVRSDVVRSFTEKVSRKGGRRRNRKVDQARPNGRQDVHDELHSDARLRGRHDRSQCGGSVVIMNGRPGRARANDDDRQDRQAADPRGQEEILMASLDTPAGRAGTVAPARRCRPASIRFRSSPPSPTDIAARAVQAAKLGGHGHRHPRHRRPHPYRRALMIEMAEIKRKSNPHEILLVADRLTGQDAVNLAATSTKRVGITGCAHAA